jgi:hypothetical protein
MTNAFWIAIVIIIIVLYCWNQYYTRHHTHEIEVDGYIINILSNNDGGNDRAKYIVSECDRRIMHILSHIRDKYDIGATEEECAPNSECAIRAAQFARRRDYFEHLLRGFNYEEIHEHAPKLGGDVAYSLDKGRKIMLCLRDARDGNIDIDTLMFVILHECAHIANYDEWGHEEQYWSIFKSLLNEAVESGAYEAINYARAPVYYCGFELNHNPYWDKEIVAM